MGKIGHVVYAGKKDMVSQRNRVKIDVGVVDIYLECEDCGKIAN